MSSSFNFPETSRRGVLKGMLAGAVAGAPAAAAVASNPVPTATYEDLTRYYAFLWSEFSELSKEMCVDMHDCWTVSRNGDMRALKEHLTSAPSTRANIVMQAIGADCEKLASTPMGVAKKQGQSAEERARYHYAEFAKAMNEATSDAGGWLIYASQVGRAPGQQAAFREPYLVARRVRFEKSTDARFPTAYIERHETMEGVYA